MSRKHGTDQNKNWQIPKLQKGAKRSYCNFDFKNKIEVRSNTAFYQLGRLNNARAQIFYLSSCFTSCLFISLFIHFSLYVSIYTYV